MGYKITSNPAAQCFEISFSGRHLASVGTYGEAADYVGECKAHDADVAAGAGRYQFPREREDYAEHAKQARRYA
jgi:hypothetical protein